MSFAKPSGSTPSLSRDVKEQQAFALGFSYFAAILCGLLTLATVSVTLWCLSIREGDTGGAMNSGMSFILVIPLASIPVGVVCFIGILLSCRAMRTYSGPSARTGLKLSLGGPVVVVVCYALCFALLRQAGF